jgi:acyl carrier protein
MTEKQIQETVVKLLGTVVPEVDPVTIDPDVDLRDQLDIDSIDFLNLMISIDAELGVDIPERDYAALSSIARMVAYLQARLP